MSNRKEISTLIEKISQDHPEYTVEQQEQAVFHACFEQELPEFPYNPVSEEAKSCLRDFAKKFWNLGALHEVIYLRQLNAR